MTRAVRLTEADLTRIVGETMRSSFEQITAQLVRSADQKPATDWARKLYPPENLPGNSPGQVRASQEKGTLAARFVMSVAGAAYVSKTAGRPCSALDYARAHWGDAEIVTKSLAAQQGQDIQAVIRALSAGDMAGGAALIPPEVSAEVIEFLRPASVFRRLGPVIMENDGGKLTLPRINVGSLASYSGENLNIAMSTLGFGDVNFTPRKLTTLIPISNDLLRRAINADVLVRDDMVAAIGQRSDLAFIRGDGNGESPVGLRNLAVTGNVIVANNAGFGSGGVQSADIRSDMGKLETLLLNAAVPMRKPGVLFAPRTYTYLKNLQVSLGVLAFPEMADGKFMGYPFAYTPQIPINQGTSGVETEVYLADFSEIIIAETTQVLIDASTDAAYFDGSVQQAAFSKDQTVVRAIIEHDLNMRHSFAAAILTGVKWGA